MKKNLLFLIFLLICENISAQINSKVLREFTANGPLENEYYRCKSGDIVTIHAYKEKGGKHHFAISNDDFANIIHFDDIPFEANEKVLKKLPNALNPEINTFIYNKERQIVEVKKEKRKKEALEGKIHFVVPDDILLYQGTNAHGNIFTGDTVYVLGYRALKSKHEYALYSKNAFGIFTSVGTEHPLSRYLNIDYLPSVIDTDVTIFLHQKKIEEKQKEEQRVLQYQNDAVEGKIKGIISDSFYTKDFGSSPFSKGDTVSVAGYSYRNYKDYYALFSNKGVGIYWTSTKSSAFKTPNNINIKMLPAVDSPEVTKALEKQQEIADSLAEKRLAETLEELAELRLSLIKIYKEHSPILITDITWSSNSIGGIEVELEVTNCSQQTIKYITFHGYFENAVGDRCRNQIGGGTTWTGKGVGPIGPAPTSLDNYEKRMAECKGSYDFDNLTFYSQIAHSFTLSSVTIQYMNGKTITLSGKSLRKHVRYRDPL